MRYLTRRLALVAGMVITVATGVAHAQQAADQRGTVRIGYDYSTGKFGTDFRATTQTTKLAAAMFAGDWTLDINVPYLRRDVENAVGARGNRVVRGILISSIGRVPRGGRITHDINEGFGDATTTASRYFYGEGAESIVWELGGTIKWNSGDANKNLGSGQRDYSLLAGGFKKAGAWNLGASLTYTFIGESADSPVNDVWGTSFDATYRIGDAWRIGTSFAWEQSAVAGGQAPRTATSFIAYRFHPAARLQLSVNRGLSDASPLWGAGASLIVNY